VVVRTTAVELLTAVLALAGVAITVGNWTILIRWHARRKHGSLIPALGGLLLAAAMPLAPIMRARHYVWLPLIVDPGCLYLLSSGVVFILKDRRR
jgi:hypothetical protein